ncbi:hypothetical protein V1358_15540 [Pseudoalteromonas sp. YIC-656]|uniref:hypothetical protein n=1 Tax=Pseudoalteromonas pernae TaxID=3118054 RepID=UPI003241F4F5
MQENSSEKASLWFKENPKHIAPSQKVLHHLLKFYLGQHVSWRKDSPVKAVLGGNGSSGRISITPQKTENIRLRFVPLDPIEHVTSFAKELESEHKTYLNFNLEDEGINITSNFNDEAIIRLLLVTDIILNKFEFTDFVKPTSIKTSIDDGEQAQIIQRKVDTFQNILLNEAAMERRFINWLKTEHNIDATSQDSDGPFRRDVAYRLDGYNTIAELKYTNSVRENIEQALGQLLRYQLHPAANKHADRLLIVSGGKAPNEDDIEWFKRLKKVLNLNIGMLYEDPTTNGKFEDIEK